MSEPFSRSTRSKSVYKRVITAVQGVTLTVAKRRIVALSGTNGAGKTTMLRAISGFLGIDDARVTEGTISFEGSRIENLRRTISPAVVLHWCPSEKRFFPISQ